MPAPTAPPLLQAYLDKRGLLVRYFTALARDASVAEEVAQDLYLKIAAVDSTRLVDNPTAFLFRSGTNIWLNRMRGAGRDQRRCGQWLENYRTCLGHDVVVDDPSAETCIAARQQLGQVRRALAELPEKTQDIFRLYRIDGLSQVAVARKLGISKSSVEKHIAATVKFLTLRMSLDNAAERRSRRQS